MAKFGHYNGADHSPIRTYEGDFLKCEGAIVTVMKSPKNGATVPEKIGVIHLDVNQSVKKLH